jgi:hypothetical protein
MWIMPGEAAIVMVTGPTGPGTAAPPATLGGYDMFALPTDGRPDLTTTNFAPFWGGDTLEFGADLDINQTPGSWATWSHGYSGTVYFADPILSGEAVTLTFPASLKAFYLYVQPNLHGLFEFEFVADGVSQMLMIEGNGGAQYVGIYTDDPLGSLTTLLVAQRGGAAEGFAIGEFASNVRGGPIVPEPAQAAGVGLLLLSGLLLRKRRPNAL